MRDKTNFLFLFLMNSISTTYTAEIIVIDACTNATNAWVLLMDSDLKSVYAVLFSCTYPVICDNCSQTPNPGL